MEFFSHQTNFPFMATRKVWYGLSAVLMVVSLGSFFVRGLNLGIDFTGGVSAEVSFPQAANLDAVRSALAASGFREPQVQSFGSSRDIDIRLPPDPQQSPGEVR
ncbi:MAG: protein translocase subunit SecF, partial [Steroidobacteraceae bacterium]